jgi:predicted small metal-binding protein
MKVMKCRDLGGACDLEFRGNTFEEIVEQSKAHGMEMFQAKDEPHLKAMQAMRELMQNPQKMASWFDSKKKEFENL